MPYIPENDRWDLRPVSSSRALSGGELNYQITMLIVQYLKTNGTSYATCNDVMGALTGAQAEFYRRVVAPYEDEKITDNGDVYDV